ncbi:hypothetical protein N0V88_007548 [Collariella sp. IMI 366227]|nr:hypothetical protein N0V88_007548 [Collariella sp. IMI 366227]
MFTGTLDRPALGQLAKLGTLYDARSDKFLSCSIFKGSAPEDAVEVKDHNSTKVNKGEANTFKERCALLGVNAELGASILAGLVELDGCATYLSAPQNRNTPSPFLQYTITTVEEQVNLADKHIKDALAFSVIEGDNATHVVVSICWGGNYIVCPSHLDSQQIQGSTSTLTKVDHIIHQLGQLLLDPQDDSSDSTRKPAATDVEQNDAASPDLSIFGDVLPNGVSAHQSFPVSFPRAFKQIRELIAATKEGKGRPIMYALLPLPFLGFFRLMDIRADLTVHAPNPDALDRLMQDLETAHSRREDLGRYLTRCRRYKSVVSADHIRQLDEELEGLMRGYGALKLDLAETLRHVRSGRAAPEQIGQLTQVFRDGGISKGRVNLLDAFSAKIDFAKSIAEAGSIYLGFGDSGLEHQLSRNPHDDAFVLFFNEEMRQRSNLWKDTFKLFMNLLHDGNQKKLTIALDCDAFGQGLERPYISHLRGRRVFVEDLLEHRKILVANCTMQYDEGCLDTALTSKPLKRRALRIPCPHSPCDESLCCSWICAVCHSPVEYGYVDDRLYCDCGATPFNSWTFKCNDPVHGSIWARYDCDLLMSRLKELEPFEEVNILILGETGVGKSTWINAFVNYLTHASLSDAIKAGELQCPIPCSFSTQMKDPNDPEGRFVQRDIKIGKSQDEHDGARGQSATQRTSVYAIDVGKTRVRLIDTPGIGDTKGLEQDNRNMADILRVLRTYDKLHGILILLKPNAARLTVMFRFCIKQLLTQLHRNAAHNIVFGFTNTRGSNYQPGDTFKPLETLLSAYNQVKMGLFHHNVYCFDSESFRYLAAQQKNIDMGLFEDNTRSWEYSVTESKRLLKHIQGLTPHQVRSTINLNETREMIVKLTEPMTRIAQSIQSSIAVNNDQIKKLSNTRMSRAELEKSLYVQRETLESYDVGVPRTVCTNGDCIEVRSDFGGRDEVVIVYTTMCHKPCGLGSSVKRNQKGHPSLERCWAMTDGFCRKCGHNFMDHMHIYYDYRPITYKHENQDVSRELLKNASDIELQEKAIELKKTAIAEFRLEHTQVQEAAIQFGFFLKRHAIEPYNDATIEYVDYLIDQEKMKIKSGGKQATLKMLEEYKDKHQQKVRAITLAMERGNTDLVLDDQGVRQLVDSLYGLPHFGEDLKGIVLFNEKAAEATFREKSCNIKTGRHWTGQSTAPQRRTSVVGRPEQPTYSSVVKQTPAPVHHHQNNVQGQVMMQPVYTVPLHVVNALYQPGVPWVYSFPQRLGRKISRFWNAN